MPSQLGQRRLLVIDDEPDTAQTLQSLLELLGCSVQVAYDGETGLGLAERERPGFVICDISMPGIDGYEVARRMRADPRHKGVVLVAVTGFGERHHRMRAFEAGFDHHLTKPIEIATLLNALKGGR